VPLCAGRTKVLEKLQSHADPKRCRTTTLQRRERLRRRAQARTPRMLTPLGPHQPVKPAGDGNFWPNLTREVKVTVLLLQFYCRESHSTRAALRISVMKRAATPARCRSPLPTPHLVKYTSESVRKCGPTPGTHASSPFLLPFLYDLSSLAPLNARSIAWTRISTLPCRQGLFLQPALQRARRLDCSLRDC